MNRPTKRIHNADTNEIIDVELTDDEWNQHKLDVENLQIRKAEAEAKVQAKAALLERLGISGDEAALLLQ